MSVNSARPRLVNVANLSIAVGFLHGQLQYFQNRGFDVTVLCPKRRKDEWKVEHPEGVPIIEVPTERKIVPWRDLHSLWWLWRLMRGLRPTITNVGTSKAGLGGFVEWLNRVPCRLYPARFAVRDHKRAQAAATHLCRAPSLSFCPSRHMCQPERAREGGCFRTHKLERTVISDLLY
jgi:Glycosyl transferase 4-like domain